MAFPVTARLGLFYGAVFLVVGILVPFWPVWLRDRGMGPAEIGLLLSAASWVRALSNPLIAQAADRRGDRRGMIVGLSFAALAAYAAFAPAQGFWALLAVTLVATSLFSAMLPLTDTITMQKVRASGIDYGRVRLWGSLSFIAAAVGGGLVLTGRPDEVVLWLVLGALALTAACALAMPREETVAANPSTRAPLRQVLGDRRYLAFLLCGSLLQASHAAYYGFATLHWRAAGIGDGMIGALWAEGVVAEIALFSVSGAVVARLGPARLFMLGAVAGAVRWTTLGLTTDVATLAAVQALHGLTFGAVHLGAMHFIANRVPPAFAATAQSLYSSTAMGVAMGLSMMAAGALYATVAGAAFYAMAGLSLAGGLVAVGLARAGRG